MRKTDTDNLNYNQQGFASIVIALILIVILALLTVGFAQLARREQQDALDKQLATQAYDAAESGINDIWQVVQQALVASDGGSEPGNGSPSLNDLIPSSAAFPGGLENPNECLENAPAQAAGLANLLPSPAISPNDGVSYSCALLNLAPPTLEYTNVDPNTEQSSTFYVTPDNPNLSLTVAWGSTDGNTNFSLHTTPGNFTPSNSWGKAPAVLQVSITPFNAISVSRSTLIANSFTTYLYPSNSGSSTVTYDTTHAVPSATTQGSVVATDCNTTSPTYPCQATITGLPAAPGEEYLLRILDYYDTSNISVSGEDAGGTQINFIDGQAQIDVTGQARTVLKRIQVRLPLSGTGSGSALPPYAVEGQNICERLEIAPLPYLGPYYDDPYGSAGGGACNPDCQVPEICSTLSTTSVNMTLPMKFVL